MKVSYFTDDNPPRFPVKLKLQVTPAGVHLLANEYYILKFLDDGTIKRIERSSKSGMQTDTLGRVKLSD